MARARGLIPEKRNQEYQRPPQTLPRSIGHYKEFLAACKTGSPTRSNFDFAGPLTEALLLGTISVRLGANGSSGTAKTSHRRRQSQRLAPLPGPAGMGA